MKKTFILLIIALCLIPNSLAFAIEKPLSLTSTQKIEELKKLEIVNCYEDGSFHPEKKITRAEFCKMVAVMLGMEKNSKTSNIFADVPAEHWANRYVTFCYDKKLIQGKAKNEFAPDDYIIYQEALKIMVSALGYEPFTARNGGYPHGYIFEATKLGISSGFASSHTECITRETAADIIYNSLFVPLLVEIEDDSETVSYVISDKSLYDSLK